MLEEEKVTVGENQEITAKLQHVSEFMEALITMAEAKVAVVWGLKVREIDGRILLHGSPVINEQVEANIM